jgi:hypothetical protein
MPNHFCETRSAVLTQLAEKSEEVVNAASQLATLAALDGKATLDQKVDFASVRTRLKALMRESEAVHEKLDAHRDEHGC